MMDKEYSQERTPEKRSPCGVPGKRHQSPEEGRDDEADHDPERNKSVDSLNHLITQNARRCMVTLVGNPIPQHPTDMRVDESFPEAELFISESVRRMEVF
jgi:hypothetical protein